MQIDISQGLETEPKLSGKGENGEQQTDAETAKPEEGRLSSSICTQQWRGQKNPGTCSPLFSRGLDLCGGMVGRVGAEAHQRCLMLNSSAPVLSGHHGSRGRIVIQAKTVTYNEAARSSGACGEGSDGRIVSRRVLGGEELQLVVTWRLPGNTRPDKATHSERQGGKIRRVLGRWMATWGLKLLLGCIQGITAS